jgi:phage gp29-like protein
MTTPNLQREIATTRDGRDITRGYVSGLLRPTDSVLINRGAGSLEIYERVATDPQVHSTYQQRQLAVTSREWVVEPGDNRRQSKAAADSLRAQLEHVGWDRVTNLMLWGVFYGYAVSELVYARDGAEVVLDAVKVRNRRRFGFDGDYGLRLLTPQNMALGEPAEPPYFWHYATGADHDDEPYGVGLAHWLYWPVLFKREGLGFWLRFLEKFGAPTVVGKYGPSATNEEKTKLLEATAAVQSDSGIILPEGMLMELLEAGRSGTPSYEVLQQRMDDTIAKVVLGQTMTSEDGSSMSQAKVHMEVRGDLVKADADLISESFNRGPARWVTALNYPTAAPPKVWRDMEDPEDLSERAERDTKVYAMGYKPTPRYVQDVYGDGWEPRQDAVDIPGGLETMLSGDPADPTPAPAFAAAGDDYLTALVDQIAAKAGPLTDAWVAQIRAEVMTAESFEQLLDRLGGLFTELPIEDLGETLAAGFGAAQLAGQADVGDE